MVLSCCEADGDHHGANGDIILWCYEGNDHEVQLQIDDKASAWVIHHFIAHMTAGLLSLYDVDVRHNASAGVAAILYCL